MAHFSRPVTVLLIDDQAIIGETVRRMLEPETDLVFHFCADPLQAIEVANAVQPTVILQDLVMPEMDGLLLVEFFRANPMTREIPMIVLSSKEEPIIKAKAFALGANDYLVKLPDRLELIARIRYHSRGYINLLERNEAYKELAEKERLMAEELAQASRYVRSLLPEKWSDKIQTDWRFVPSTQLAGDMFGYHWLDADHAAIYLLDVSGHGVGSALLAVSAGNILTNRSLPNTDFSNPGQVLTRLNDVFQMEKQNNKYFTIWYGVLNVPKRELVYSNGGHPAPLLFHGSLVQELESLGFAIGMVPDYAFESATLTLEPNARLLLYSDGVYEIEQPNAPMWTFDEFTTWIKNRPHGELGSIIDQLHHHVQSIHGSPILGDDFSMLEIRFSR